MKRRAVTVDVRMRTQKDDASIRCPTLQEADRQPDGCFADHVAAGTYKRTAPGTNTPAHGRAALSTGQAAR